ncbi:MAG: GDYXXLXY domain-containing protein [Helicobacteraceae bacterium]|jgi:uncharacterized membrane-anchored protein|nr:GDYXXLXY domain-containing protein [Helicobacteraceae bacterium]
MSESLQQGRNAREFLQRNGKKIAIAALGVLIAAQLFAAFYQILKYESVLRYGKPIVLDTTAYDPFDPLRGRYIRLNIANGEFQTSEKLCDRIRESTLFVTYKDELDDRNLSVIDNVYLTKPKTELAYLKVDGFCGYSRNAVEINYNFDRYYMQEDQAKAVDLNARLMSRESKASVIVRALDGKGVIEKVMIGSQTLEEYLRDQEQDGLQEQEEND